VAMLAAPTGSTALYFRENRAVWPIAIVLITAAVAFAIPVYLNELRITQPAESGGAVPGQVPPAVAETPPGTPRGTRALRTNYGGVSGCWIYVWSPAPRHRFEGGLYHSHHAGNESAAPGASAFNGGRPAAGGGV
jgi:hypothetical protein